MFRQETVASTWKAVELTPDQAPYWVRLALLVYDDDPVRSARGFERAVAVNPRDARSWIELGLRLEADGEMAAAERSLLRAAAVDKQYLPRWTLANYYFRRGNTERFWFWARRANGMAYADLSPLFRLCWMVTKDGKAIEQQLGLSRPDLHASYLSFVIDNNRVDSIAPAARRLLASRREEDRPILLAACERLLDVREVTGALEIWNSLAETHAIPFQPLTPATGVSLTNGNFSIPPSARGFDWRLPAVQGISVARHEDAPGLRVTFSGQQPEICETVSQFLPVVEGRTYMLTVSYQTLAVRPGTGLTFRVADAENSKILGQTQNLSSEIETQDTLSFVTPRGCRLVRLVLVYERAAGTTRIEGSIVLRSVSMRPNH